MEEKNINIIKQKNEINKNNSIEKENINKIKKNNDNSLNKNNLKEKESRKNIKNKTNKKNIKIKKNIDQQNTNKENEEKNKKNAKNKEPIIKVKIVDELPKDHVLENKIKNTVYKIIFVYHDQDNFVSVKPELTMINLFKKIGKKLNIASDKLILKYKDKEILEKYNNLTVKEFFNFPINKSRPILYVKIKHNTNNNSQSNLISEIEKYNLFYKKSYDNKVKIINYPSMTDISVGVNKDIYSIINNFLKESGIISDFTCERKEENKENKNKISNGNIDLINNEQISNINNSDNNININLEENKSESNINNINNMNENNNKPNVIVYYIGFPSPDIAFDFNRYMNSLRLMNPIFKNIKSNYISSRKKSRQKIKLSDEQYEINKRTYNYRYGTSLNLEEKDPDKRNIEILNIIRNNYLNNKMNCLIKGNNSSNFLRISSPYSTPYDERIKDNIENKKKWLSPKGFISSVNKYSGIYI